MDSKPSLTPLANNTDLYQWYLVNLLNTMNSVPVAPLWYITIDGIPNGDMVASFLTKEPQYSSTEYPLNNYDLLVNEQVTRTGLILAQGIDLPGDGIGANRTGVENSGYIKGFVGSGRNDLAPLGITFLETNLSFTDLVLRPWTIATGYASLKTKLSTDGGLKALNITCYLLMKGEAGTKSDESPNYYRDKNNIENESYYIDSVTDFDINDKYSDAKYFTEQPYSGPISKTDTNTKITKTYKYARKNFFNKSGGLTIRKAYTFYNVCPISIEGEQYDYGDKIMQRKVSFAYDSYTINDPTIYNSQNVKMMSKSIPETFRKADEINNTNIKEVEIKTRDRLRSFEHTDANQKDGMGWLATMLTNQVNRLVTNVGREGINTLQSVVDRVKGIIETPIESAVDTALGKVNDMLESAKGKLLGSKGPNEDTVTKYNSLQKVVNGTDSVRGDNIPVEIIYENRPLTHTPNFIASRDDKSELINNANSSNQVAKTSLKDSVDTPLFFPGAYGQEIKISQTDITSNVPGPAQQQVNVNLKDVVDTVALRHQNIVPNANDNINGQHAASQSIDINTNDVAVKPLSIQPIDISNSDTIRNHISMQITNISPNDNVNGKALVSQNVDIKPNDVANGKTLRSQSVDINEKDSVVY